MAVNFTAGDVLLGRSADGHAPIEIEGSTIGAGADFSNGIDATNDDGDATSNFDDIEVSNDANIIRNTDIGGTLTVDGDTTLGTVGTGNTTIVELGGNDSARFIVNADSDTAAVQIHGHATQAAIFLSNLPTSSTGLNPGQVWNNSGVLNIIP